MGDEKFNISINEGKEFYAHEMSINYNPTQFIMDFKCVTPRVDARSKDQPTIAVNHNIIMTEPYHAKQIHSLLGKVIAKYEKEYGKIEKPKAIEMFEKKHKQKLDDMRKDKTEQMPNYFG